MPGAGFDFLEQVFAGLLHGQAGDFLKLALMLVGLLGKVLLQFAQVLFLLDELLFQLHHLGFLVGDLLPLGVEALLFGMEALFLALELAFAVLEFPLQLFLLIENFILCLETRLLLESLAFLAGLFHNAFGQSLGVGYLLVGDVFEEKYPDSEADDQCSADHGDLG